MCIRYVKAESKATEKLYRFKAMYVRLSKYLQCEQSSINFSTLTSFVCFFEKLFLILMLVAAF